MPKIIFISGACGSGKSTFLRSLNLLEEPTGGAIIFNNVDITKKKYKDESEWLFHVTLDAVSSDRLFGRYKDIEAMIAELKPRGYPTDSAAYYIMAHFDIYKLIYAVIRHVDDIEENYDSLAYTFFLGILAKCWGEGYGWSKSEDGVWRWKRIKKENRRRINNEP